MLQTLKARLADRKHDEGFTLIELMVVVLIIAILLAIAIPTFLGAQNKAKDRSAQSSLRDTVVAAKSVFVDTQDYTKADVATLTAGEPALAFQTAASGDPKVVSVGATASEFTAAAYSKAGNCFFIKDSATAGTTYNKASSGTCSAAAAPTTGWTTGW
jgi:type IV pilus assembly protein PilA